MIALGNVERKLNLYHFHEAKEKAGQRWGVCKVTDATTGVLNFTLTGLVENEMVRLSKI